MQVARNQPGFPFVYRNSWHGLVEITQKEGVAALFRGAGARVAFQAPSTAITIGVFDTLRQTFQRLNSQSVSNV